MGNANSSNNHASLRHHGEISRRRRRMHHHPNSPEDILASSPNDRDWLDNDNSFSSTEANEPPHGHGDSLSSPTKASLPIYWNVRLRAVDQGNNECPVCASEFEVNDAVALLPCGHYFCKDCMMKWMTYEKCTCPLCRHDLQASATARRRMYTRVACAGPGLATNAQQKHPTSAAPCTDNCIDQNFDLIMSKMLNDKAISTGDSKEQ